MLGKKGSSGKVRLTRGLGELGYGIDNRVLLVAWKELTEALRDRRTILNVILLPMILIPLSMSIPLLLMAPRGIVQTVTLVVVEDLPSVPLVRDEILARAGINGTIISSKANATQLILENKADLVLVIPKGFRSNLSSSKCSAKVLIYYDPFNMRSSVVMSQLQLAFKELSEKELKRRLEQANLSPELATPVKVISTEVSRIEATPAAVVGAMLLPIMVGGLAITGAGTFALDMMAGERERKTIEAVLTVPVPKLKLLLGKYVAMLVLSVISGFSMIVSFLLGFLVLVNYAITPFSMVSPPSTPQLGQFESLNISKPLPFIPFGQNLASLLLTLGLAIVLAGLTGDALVVVGSSFASSFKEAQQYTGFIMVGFVIPLISVIYLPPRLIWPFRMLPITSLSLLVRDVLVNPGDKAAIITSSSSSLIYLIFFLLLSAKLFGRESVIFD